jgi:hypothetical protein
MLTAGFPTEPMAVNALDEMAKPRREAQKITLNIRT